MKRLYRLRIILLILSVSLLALSCEKWKDGTSDSGQPDKFEELNVESSFKFKSTQSINANFTINPASQDEAQHIIKVYIGHPAKGGRLLTKGITKNYQFIVQLTIPSRVEKLYVENRNSQGIYELAEVPVSGQNIDHTFNSKQAPAPDFLPNKSVIVDPGCEECEESISGIHNSLQLNGKDYCVPEGSNLTIGNQLRFKNGATLVICGTANIRQFSVQGNNTSKLYISESGRLSTSGHLNINQKLDFFNFGIYDISGNVSPNNNPKFYNYGTMNIAGTVNNGTDEFRNEGTMNISGHFNTNNDFQNYGTMIITGHLQINGNAKAYNYCNLQVEGNLMLNSRLENHSYVQVGDGLTINGGGKLTMVDGALVDTKNLMIDGTIEGTGNSFSKVDISENTTINGGGKVQGKMDLCDANDIETNNGNISSNVVYCETTVPANACNPGSEGEGGGSGGGGGSGEPNDTDGDGVPDTEDDYPDDTERAFNNYYPNEHDFGTFAFEDLWTNKGDYDFNDLVLDFQYKIVTNSDNLIVDIIMKTHVKAAGATLNNGFGISIPVAPANCGNVSGYEHATNNLDINPAGYENGHSNHTVVILYDAINTIYGSPYFNTVPGGNVVETDTITVTTYFDNPQLAMGQEPYNPFIYAGQDRGREIHLVDNPPTDLVNMDYFGSDDDDSNPNSDRWYVTPNNLPWAVEIPSSFDYPVESVDIVDAYLKFAEWAESSGAVYSDWYLNEPAYRNDENIYSAQ